MSRTGATSNFDLTQTAYLFNWVANAACITTGTPGGLADFVYTALYGTANTPQPAVNNHFVQPGLLPTLGSSLVGAPWELVWGPGVFEFSDSQSEADNTAFVVYSSTLNTYVVAIAGTNPAAFLDWLNEDLQVGTKYCADWPTLVSSFTSITPPSNKIPQPSPTDAVAGNVQVSYGTALGIWALGTQLTLSASATSSSTPAGTNNTKYPTLIGYLQSLATTASAGAQLIFTGHSLGGALSPTLAAWANGFNTPKVKVPAGIPGFPGTIYAMPTAGPTPGNGTYQGAWDTTFPIATPANTGGRAFDQYNVVTKLNQNIFNTQDVVPHAWSNIYSNSVKNIPTIYFYHNPAFLSSFQLDSAIGKILAAVLNALVNKAQTNGTNGNMTLSANGQAFTLGETIPLYPSLNMATWPINEYADGNPATLAAPPTDFVTDYGSFTNYLGTIHVWGYGSYAFDIDFSVFQSIHPAPLVG